MVSGLMLCENEAAVQYVATTQILKYAAAVGAAGEGTIKGIDVVDKKPIIHHSQGATDAGTGFESVIMIRRFADASQAGGHRVFGSHRAARTASSKRTVSLPPGLLARSLLPLQ